MRFDRIKHLTQLAVVGDDEVDAAVVADASRLTDCDAPKVGKASDAALSARSAEGARISVQRDAFGNDLDAAGSPEGVQKPKTDLGKHADRRTWSVHLKFSVGCVATPTRSHPAAPVKLAGGVIAPAMA